MESQIGQPYCPWKGFKKLPKPIMKKIIFALFLLTSISLGDYVSSGSGTNKGEAYIKAMSNAPSGGHWVLHNIYYGSNGTTCTITWKIRK